MGTHINTHLFILNNISTFGVSTVCAKCVVYYRSVSCLMHVKAQDCAFVFASIVFQSQTLIVFCKFNFTAYIILKL